MISRAPACASSSTMVEYSTRLNASGTAKAHPAWMIQVQERREAQLAAAVRLYKPFA